MIDNSSDLIASPAAASVLHVPEPYGVSLASWESLPGGMLAADGRERTIRGARAVHNDFGCLRLRRPVLTGGSLLKFPLPVLRGKETFAKVSCTLMKAHDSAQLSC